MPRLFQAACPPIQGRGASLSDCRAGCLASRSEEHTSELQSQSNLVCRLLLEKKKNYNIFYNASKHIPFSLLRHFIYRLLFASSFTSSPACHTGYASPTRVTECPRIVARLRLD